MIRRSTLLAAEILLGLAAALIIGLGVAWWRLSQGPVELNLIRDQVVSELSRAREGRPVGIERVELAWSRAGNALELRAVGISVEDGRGHVLSQAREARIELGVLPLLIGQISLRRADFIGGALSITHKADGETQLAFGPPGTPPDIILPASAVNETLEQRVNRALDGLEAAFRPVGPGGRLQSIGVHNAQLAIIDEAGGGRWTADDANLELARDGQELKLHARARLEGAQGLAPASLRITTDTHFQSAIVEFGAENVRPRALFSQAALGPFGALDAPLTATVSVGLDRRAGLTRLEGEATLGRGAADMAGGRFDLAGGSIRGRYDIDSDELILDQMRLAGARTQIRGEVRIANASAILRAQPDQPAPFNIVFPALTLDVPGTFAAPAAFSRVEVAGAILTGDRTVRFDRIRAHAGEGQVDLTGRFYWGEAGPDHRLRPGVALEGGVTGVLTTQQVLQAWPMGLASQTRDYLARSITAGRVTDARVKIDLRPSDTLRLPLRNEAIDVRFNITGGEMHFLQTMSPVTAARGSAVLQGNRFEMIVPEARINNVPLTNGRIEAPRFHGDDAAMLTISARADGEMRNVLEVLAQEPLRLGNRLPVDIATASGRGAVNLRLQRPMHGQVPFEQWRFNIDGQIENFAGQMPARRVALAQGRLAVHGDQRMINVSGPIRAGGSAVNVSWNEYLNRPGRASSEYQISGDFDADDLVRLGYTIARYAEGRLNLTISGQGRGFDVDHAQVEVDMRNAAVQSPWRFWTKRAGTPAVARFNIDRENDGSLTFANIDARGAGLIAQGSARVTRAGEILNVNLPRLAIDGRSDAHLVATRGGDGGLDVRVTGPLFDGAPFMDGDDADPAAPTGAAAIAAHLAEPPLRANIQVAALKLRGGATLQNANVQVLTQRGALAVLTAEGRSPGDKQFSLAMGVQGRLRFRAEDAGFAVRALTGSENVVGGRVSADGDWRPGPPSGSRFTVAMRDFQVVRMPAMARLLSSAGSLTGLVEMLNGEGIGMSALDTQVVYANDRLTFSDARAAGPSIGLTASGTFDMKRDNLDIDGVVAPSPGLNLSMLGEVPLIGDLLVSRRGEGVFGMTYSINGHVAEPRVGVNPVSALTPGILRRIFEPLQRPQRSAPPVPQASVQPSSAPAQAAAVQLGDATAP